MGYSKNRNKTEVWVKRLEKLLLSKSITKREIKLSNMLENGKLVKVKAEKEKLKVKVK